MPARKDHYFPDGRTALRTHFYLRSEFGSFAKLALGFGKLGVFRVKIDGDWYQLTVTREARHKFVYQFEFVE